jgi:MFS family permease
VQGLLLMKKDSFRVAFCGLVSALSLVLMLFTSVIPVGTYAFPCIAGILLVSVVIEFGWKWALAAYGVVSLLSLFLAGDKEAVVYFIAFFGFYPIAKSGIERIKSVAVQYLLKYLVFTVCVIVAFYATTSVLMIPAEEFEIFGVYLPWVFLLAGELVFWFYDRCVTILVARYIISVRSKLFHF